MWLAFLLAIGIPLFFLYLIHILEVYTSSRPQVMVLAVGWGITAFFLALAINETLLSTNLTDLVDLRLVAAPIIEEILKSSILILLTRRLILRYAADGTAYGFAIGTGFAMFENLLYVLNNPDTGVQLAMARALSTSLVHSFNTAIIGTVAGASLALPPRVQINRFVISLAVAISVHAAFNSVVGELSGALLLLAGISIGLGSVLVIVAMMQRTLEAESHSMQLKLADVLSAGEVAAARNPEQLAQILAQHRGEIGEQRIRLIQQYIGLQAQRGILRKNITLSQNPKLIEALNRQLENTTQQLDVLRGSMGLYTWIWLRSVLPSEESDIWLRLDSELKTDRPQLARLIELNERQVRVPHVELIKRKQILRKGPLFSDLADEDLADLALLLSEERFHVGDEVIRQSDKNDHLYIVASGTLVVAAADEQQVQTMLTAYSSGDIFGELGILDEQMSSVTVSCLENVTLYSLSRADLITLLYAKPQVALEMMRELAHRIRQQTALLMWVQQTASPSSSPEASLKI